MKNEINSKKILDDLGKTDKERVTLYLSKRLYSEFKKACGDIAASRVVERLIEDFMDSHKQQTKQKK
ncbi:MAG: hypothetical protein HQK50_12980 [Oligoflexia bacterium]|nr:hypothetical protein [Oligoflexia bacterium]